MISVLYGRARALSFPSPFEKRPAVLEGKGFIHGSKFKMMDMSPDLSVKNILNPVSEKGIETSRAR